jgi:hypothetical protein
MDRPAVEFHPYGTITLNFDDGPVKLRRCRLGDLEYAKNLLEEIRQESAEQRERWLAEITETQAGFPQGSEDERTEQINNLTEEERADLTNRLNRINDLNDTLRSASRDLVHRWLSAVAERMGDRPLPPKDEWPLDILAVAISDVIDHWQNRPLASGRISPNGTTGAANSSPTPVPIQSSPQEQPQS